MLLEGNPLEDVSNAARIAGVMLRGRWLPRAELDRRMEDLAAGYSRPRDRFAGMPPLPTEGEEEVSALYEIPGGWAWTLCNACETAGGEQGPAPDAAAG